MALHEGLSWEWQSFPEYLDDLDARPHDIDLGAQVPHGALRLYVMGERGADREPATPDDIAAMAELARRGDRGRRPRLHHLAHAQPPHQPGELTPSLNAEEDELVGIAEALGAIGTGVLQVVSDFNDVDAEFDLLPRHGPALGPADLDLVAQVAAASRAVALPARPHERRHARTGIMMRGQVRGPRRRPAARLRGHAATRSCWRRCGSGAGRTCRWPSGSRACARTDVRRSAPRAGRRRRQEQRRPRRSADRPLRHDVPAR